MGQQCQAINNHATRWYIPLPVHYHESDSDRIRVPRSTRSARVSRSSCGKGGAILRPVSGQPPIDSPPLDAATRRRFNSRTKKASGGHGRPVFLLVQHPASSTSSLYARPIAGFWADPETSFGLANRGESLTRVSGQIVLCRWLMP